MNHESIWGVWGSNITQIIKILFPVTLLSNQALAFGQINYILWIKETDNPTFNSSMRG